ncbi:MAG: bifunctional DNA-formamidopyrimidine glycosylase/DNA-(apurinic or apyrimidinic site) lyase [Limnochordia bacterium]|jgi:formamidopyrimidine-DNA glycosylase
MPELPEVECVRLTLLPHLLNRSVTSVEVFWEKTLAGIAPVDLRSHLVSARFTGAARRGKFLGLQLDETSYLVVHLRMTGRLSVHPVQMPRDGHLRLAIGLDNAHELRFVDQRKFGRVFWAQDEAQWVSIADVGIEPLSPGFTPEALATILQGRKMQIKAALLDQRRIAGLGNIYCDESLFRASLHPQRSCGELNSSEVERLWLAIQSSLMTALENGGTTLRDFMDGDGQPGANQHHLLVYGRAGEPCLRCGSVLERLKVAGRGTTFCPHCQL